MRKISFKIILAIAICSILLTVTVGVISIRQSSAIITAEVKESIRVQALRYANEYNLLLKGAESGVDGLVSTTNATFDVNTMQQNPAQYMESYQNAIAPAVKELANSTDGIVTSYVVFDPELLGSLYQVVYQVNEDQSLSRITPITADMFTQDNEYMQWYYKPLENQKGVWINLYYDENIKANIITYARPIYKNGTFIGVAGMDVRFDRFSEAINAIKNYQTGYAFLMSEDYYLLVHPTFKLTDNFKEVEDGRLAFLVDEIELQPAGVQEYIYDGDSKLLGYSHLTNGQILCIAANEKEALQKIDQLQLLLIGVIIAGILAACLLGIVIARTISKPLENLQEAFGKAADGDLTVQAEVRSKDEVGVVAEHFGVMIAKIRNLIGKIADTSTSVKSASDMLAKASMESSASSEEVSASISEVALRATDQSQVMERAAELTRMLADHVGELGKVGEHVGEAAGNSSKNAQLGKERIQTIAKQMEQIRSVIEETSRVVSQLVDKSAEIGKIVEMIDRIANQTQLLALNAAIEAARAGEAGQGFAVVADEIKSLSEETLTSAAQINQLVRETQDEAKRAHSAMGQGIQEVQTGNKVVQSTLGVFDDIVSAAEDNLQFTEQTNRSVQTVNTMSNEILQKISEVAAIAQETSASTQEVSASTEEQAATIEEISTSAEMLQQMAEELNQLIRGFKIS